MSTERLPTATEVVEQLTWVRSPSRRKKGGFLRMTLPAPRTGIGRPRRWSGVSLLLLPAVGLAWVPSYAREVPRLFDVPFFYWYQLTWIGLCIACMAGAALLFPSPDRSPDPGGSS